MKHKLSLDACGQRCLPLYNNEHQRRAADIQSALEARRKRHEPPLQPPPRVLGAPLLPGRR